MHLTIVLTPKELQKEVTETVLLFSLFTLDDL